MDGCFFLQPEADGSHPEVAALWQDVICGGPHNALWVLAPRRPLSAWVALAAAGGTFQAMLLLSGKQRKMAVRWQTPVHDALSQGVPCRCSIAKNHLYPLRSRLTPVCRRKQVS